MKKKTGFTLVEVMIVVAIIALLSAVGIPSFLNSREKAAEQMKLVNIDTINSAKDQWAILNNKSDGTSVAWDDIEDYIGGGIDSLSDLTIDGKSLSINAVGTSASY
jgi:prepilin-type N-terminal cleavage/methylation domain-containing protein